jgi:hypothetical protein
MTESEFVLWYVNKHYLFTGSKFKYKYTLDETSISFAILYRNINDSIAIDKVDGELLYDFMLNWYTVNEKNAKIDVLDFLKYKYKVTLGPTNWVISKMSGKIVNTNNIISELNKHYDIEFLATTIEDWFENEMIRITETSTLHFK